MSEMKPQKKWCVYNSNGEIIHCTLSESELSAIYKYEQSSMFFWHKALELGYSCIPVMITPITESKDESKES